MKQIYAHYEHCWGQRYTVRQWTAGPVWELGPEFRVLEFPPRSDCNWWTYATVGMSLVPEAGRSHGLELHLVAPTKADAHIELLTAVAHYHLTGRPLGWAHTVNFGRPWYPRSRCCYGLLSLPYLDGPKLEWLGTPGTGTRVLWLVPITGAERSFVIEQEGIEELERLFEQTSFNYLDPKRASVI